MTDTRLPDRWLNDRRLHRSPAHFQSFVCALMFTVGNRTDGLIEESDLGEIPHFDESLLPDFIASGLFTVAPTGWFLPEFGETQTSRAEHESAAKARQSNRERQAAFRARAAQKAADEAQPINNVISNVISNVTNNVTETVTTQAGRQVVTDVTTCPLEDNQATVTPISSKALLLPKSGTSPTRAKPRTRIGDDWQPPPDARHRMREKFPDLDLSAEREAFINHHQAHGKLMADWTKAFWTWLNNTRKFGANGSGPTRINGYVVSTATEKALTYQSMKDSGEPPRDPFQRAQEIRNNPRRELTR